jgi:hypothetical protein
MTAEVVILNKSAVALAADSTVTISSSSNDRKTYNSVNKLFTLSKHQPVGVMIYGDASFMGVPWEVVLKDYRRQLGKRSFSTLSEYLSDFVSFVENAEYLNEPESEFVRQSAYRLMRFIAQAIGQHCSPTDSPADATQTTAIADLVIRDWQSRVDALAPLPSAGDDFATKIQAKFEKEFREAREFAFEDSEILLSDFALTSLPAIAARAIATGLIPADSGLVLAGFGDKQVFPAVATISPLLLACNKFLYKRIEGKCYEVNFFNEAALLPFAQQDVVTTFLDGIDPQIHQIVDSSVSQLLEEFPSVAMETLKIDSDGKEAELAELRDKMNRVKSEFFKRIADYKLKYHTNPLLDVLAVLPKDELAATAESLVSLTAIKRKMSLEIETVGGPIDVAVISKGDGFVWIKRKHYFSPELNPQFVQNYFER